MSVVEQYARARIVTDADVQEDQGTIPVVLRYDSAADPRVVSIGLPGGQARSFPRDLLERGLRAPTGTGEVRVWPCGRVQTVIEVHSAQGASVVQIESKALLRFLRRTYMAVEPVPH
ncbi:SsgA family sporulation/cell division regulator [Streptomyces sp. NPDC090306]|uniref:SsgA family sporulation/cell division regulator n=1 Tax=Streptomyces sp. NPDC090306 TaxID=3365961 RepID=UPI0037F31B98